MGEETGPVRGADDPAAPERQAGGPAEIDALEEALSLVRGADEVGIPLRLVGGLAVRVLCPDFPPRVRDRQDLDLASVSRARAALTAFLAARGYEPDRRFNALYGHKQLFFASPRGRAVDVLIDKLDMCHVLPFHDRIERMPLTLDVTDLLLSKLQIVELNEKDVRDVLYLLSAYPVAEGDEPGTIGLDRIRALVADDWGWWRTLTLNVSRIRALAAERGDLVPPAPSLDPLRGLEAVAEAAEAVPKTLRWKLRARVGERKRWYRLPEEIQHD
ncbi:MAG TPA: hypothetical protein VNO79_05570 [Actinomycetota bacterium]|nr:hypothetical protein [Actinomycetota bacterium]